MSFLAINEVHMNEIVTEYKKAVDAVDDVISMMNIVLNKLEYYYDGQAKEEIIPETVAKIIEHLNMLGACYENMGIYVENTKNNMKLYDEKYKNIIGKAENLI